MAEFAEVAKISKRICENHNGLCVSTACPLSRVKNGKDIEPKESE